MKEKSTPFFSIIIPTYNVEKSVHKTLDSVISQSFHDFECLVMDGGSTDQTLKIINLYQHNDPRIRVVSNKDKGIYDAMNKGVNISNGQFLYFIGADDHFRSDDILNIVYQKIIKEYPDIIYGNVNSPVLGNKYDGKFNPGDLTYKNICHQSIFFKSTVFNHTGNFNLKYHVHADWDHNLKWFFNPKFKITYINQIIAFYDGNGYSYKNKDISFKKVFPLLFFKNARQRFSGVKILRMLISGFIKKHLLISKR